MCLRGWRASRGSLIAATLLFVGCGGGGGSGDGEAPRRDISGTWTFACEQNQPGQWRAETLQFDEPAGGVTHAGLEYATADCSDPGVTIVEETGSYTAGKAIDCASGSDSRCTELDIVWADGSRDFGVYSVDGGGDPDRLLLSRLESDPTLRPADVDPSFYAQRAAFPDKYGHAVVDVYLVDGGYSAGHPAPAAGYEWFPYDLNAGSGGHYIWLYYRMGRANGADGVPLGEIYTVAEFRGETPTKGGTKLPVNLNAGPIMNHDLWLYKRTATDVIVRCIAIAFPPDGGKGYGPPTPEGTYPLVWVEELRPDSLKNPFPGFPSDVQDLNQSEGFWTQYIYLGYCAD